jgi:hypothetical protein
MDGCMSGTSSYCKTNIDSITTFFFPARIMVCGQAGSWGPGHPPSDMMLTGG